MGKSQALIKIKPKKYKDGEVVKVSFMVMHPMETGLRKDKKTKQVIPALYINDVKFEYNGKVITTMKVWETLSVNPVFTTYMKINGSGELKVTYTDSSGEVNEKSTKIKPKG
ncbi:thiosulfate oxidation carrier complex protein SoxZ [Candidatus Sulfurimonas marisnigri]|uniref:Thiosulfate oxidation carrier complex protein SoxZ n=1 Tax=Candidatus Sulfurimonas marisnigri TaxID=2740405 RepID=A0A7S7M0R0_9BACT|nr:thiosulfate oxidation carrier complex protein SoxZ [Candidatus Sulfurimonas marisnigri]QOY54863.1 thiosulfate oxidation carrier complex protein SoxZ [Candidatus Sulfurimonas marisnigri]